MIFRLGLLNDDPRLTFKKKVCTSFSFAAVGLQDEADLVDFSEREDVVPAQIEEASKRSCVLVSPALLMQNDSEALDVSSITLALPLREWALVSKIKSMKDEDICGELTSLRFTWTRPKSMSSSEDGFLYNTLAGLIDAAEYIAGAKVEQIYVEKVRGCNNLFALVMLEGEVAVEIEANECQPNSMPAVHFIKANFSDGIITNVPLVGHFNEEGSIFATDEKLERLVIENDKWDGGDEIENTYWSMILSISEKTYCKKNNMKNILSGIRQSIKTQMPVNFGGDT